MKVLVTGGRDHKDPSLINATLDGLFVAYTRDELLIIHGAAKGADTYAEQWAHKNHVATVSYPADWNANGKAAGAIRNQKMLDEMEPDLVMAFPTRHSKGTWDMVRRAQKQDVDVIITEED